MMFVVEFAGSFRLPIRSAVITEVKLLPRSVGNSGNNGFYDVTKKKNANFTSIMVNTKAMFFMHGSINAPKSQIITNI